MQTLLSALILLVVSASATLGIASQVSSPTTPETPYVEGSWWRIATNPDMGSYSDPAAQPVDFSIWQAADGTWQLVACVRKTQFPGGGRLFYRWEAENLTDTDWEERGIFMTSDAHPEHRQGHLQAPHVIRTGNLYVMHYNSNGSAFALTSLDGKHFVRRLTPDGEARHFDMGRDVMVFDNRERDSKVYAYYTAIVAPHYPERRNHTVGVRVAPGLDGPWGDLVDIGVNTPNNPDPEQAPYNFINAESPFVLFRKGYYYRWEQMKVFASRDPLHWTDPEVTTLTGDDPRAYYAPEIIEHDGEYYVAGYQYNNESQGIYIAPMAWR